MCQLFFILFFRARTGRKGNMFASFLAHTTIRVVSLLQLEVEFLGWVWVNKIQLTCKSALAEFCGDSFLNSNWTEQPYLNLKHTGSTTIIFYKVMLKREENWPKRSPKSISNTSIICREMLVLNQSLHVSISVLHVIFYQRTLFLNSNWTDWCHKCVSNLHCIVDVLVLMFQLIGSLRWWKKVSKSLARKKNRNRN